MSGKALSPAIPLLDLHAQYRRGIGIEVYYPVPFHLQECFAVTEAQQVTVVDEVVRAVRR